MKARLRWQITKDATNLSEKLLRFKLQIPIALAMSAPMTLLRRVLIAVLVTCGSWILLTSTLYKVAPSRTVDVLFHQVFSILVFPWLMRWSGTATWSFGNHSADSKIQRALGRIFEIAFCRWHYIYESKRISSAPGWYRQDSEELFPLASKYRLRASWPSVYFRLGQVTRAGSRYRGRHRERRFSMVDASVEYAKGCVEL